VAEVILIEAPGDDATVAEVERYLRDRYAELLRRGR
jgi:hypothetical protein